MEEVSKRNGVVNKGPQQMSASLKERLKRCGRYYSSPMTTKMPKLDTGFLPSPDSTSSPSSLNFNCSTPTINRPIYETPPNSILTPSSSEDHRNSSFEDSASLSCTPVLKAKDLQGSHPRVKRLRLSSRTCFNAKLSPGDVPDSMQEEGDGSLPQQETLSLNTPLLEESILQISACGDGECEYSKSPEKHQLSLVSGVCLLSGDNVPNDEISAEVVPENLTCEELVAKKLQLQKQLKEKEECLRKLKMVKLYRSKNDLSNLDDLIIKWREVSQQVLLDLHQKLPEPKPSLSCLLQHLHIDPTFLRFNSDEEAFY